MLKHSCAVWKNVLGYGIKSSGVRRTPRRLCILKTPLRKLAVHAENSFMVLNFLGPSWILTNCCLRFLVSGAYQKYLMSFPKITDLAPALT